MQDLLDDERLTVITPKSRLNRYAILVPDITKETNNFIVQQVLLQQQDDLSSCVKSTLDRCDYPNDFNCQSLENKIICRFQFSGNQLFITCRARIKPFSMIEHNFHTRRLKTNRLNYETMEQIVFRHSEPEVYTLVLNSEMQSSPDKKRKSNPSSSSLNVDAFSTDSTSNKKKKSDESGGVEIIKVDDEDDDIDLGGSSSSEADEALAAYQEAVFNIFKPFLDEIMTQP